MSEEAITLLQRPRLRLYHILGRHADAAFELTDALAGDTHVGSPDGPSLLFCDRYPSVYDGVEAGDTAQRDFDRSCCGWSSRYDMAIPAWPAFTIGLGRACTPKPSPAEVPSTDAGPFARTSRSPSGTITRHRMAASDTPSGTATSSALMIQPREGYLTRSVLERKWMSRDVPGPSACGVGLTLPSARLPLRA